MKTRLLLSFLFSFLILDLVNGYIPQSKDKATGLNENDDSWHKPREGSNNFVQSSTDRNGWMGRWLPPKQGEPTPPPKVLHVIGSFKNPNVEKHSTHVVGMGILPGNCDDGITNLNVDWDRSPVNYTCYDQKIIPNYSTRPMIYCEHIPVTYKARHNCMSVTIDYDDDIPMYGSHRPVWPVYGEYKFIPRQRWIHSLEHGAIVMLYHPCANPLEVKRLKQIVTGCLRRHIITPYTLLDENRPLALVTWGCRLTMSTVNPSIVQQFIKERALRGAEKISVDGDFDDYMTQKSKTLTDDDDTTLCPSL